MSVVSSQEKFDCCVSRDLRWSKHYNVGKMRANTIDRGQQSEVINIASYTCTLINYFRRLFQSHMFRYVRLHF